LGDCGFGVDGLLVDSFKCSWLLVLKHQLDWAMPTFA